MTGRNPFTSPAPGDELLGPVIAAKVVEVTYNADGLSTVGYIIRGIHEDYRDGDPIVVRAARDWTAFAYRPDAVIQHLGKPITAVKASVLEVQDGLGYRGIPSPNFIGRCGCCRQVVTSLDRYCRDCGSRLEWMSAADPEYDREMEPQ